MNVPIFRGNGIIEYQDRDIPVMDAHNNVLVELSACGICGTDLNILATPPMHKAAPNIVIGHEGVGVVKEVYANSSDFSPGDRVVIAPRILCGKCKYCRMGLGNQCLNYKTVGTTRDGAFAPFISLPDSALYRISEDVPLDDAVFFEPLSCVVGAVSRPSFDAGNTVLIVGAGPMGALFALLYKAMGAGRVVMLDLSEERLNFYKKESIADTINVKDFDKEELEKKLKNLKADIAVDAVGNQMTVCINALRRGGQAILFGLKSGQSVSVEQYQITRNDITLHGAFVGLNPFVDTINILERRVVLPSKLITDRFPLSKLREGIDTMRQARGMKAIIEISAEDVCIK